MVIAIPQTRISFEYGKITDLDLNCSCPDCKRRSFIFNFKLFVEQLS